MNKKFRDLADSYLGLRVSDGAGSFIAGFVFLYIAQIILVIIASISHIELGTSNQPYWFTYIIMVVNQLALVFSVWAYGSILQKPLLQTCRIERKLSVFQGLMLPVIAVVCIMAFFPIADGFVRLVQLITGEQQQVNISIGTEWWQIILSVLFVALLPALGEEILFRGTVARGLKRKGYLFGIIMSGFLFSIFHGNAAQTVHQFLIGMVFAYVYFVSGSLLASVILHFCNNAIAILLEFIFKQYLPKDPNMNIVIIVYVCMSIVGFVLLYFLLRLFMAKTKEERNIVEPDKDKNAWAKDLINAFTSSGIKDNYRRFERSMTMLFDDPDDNAVVDEVQPVDDGVSEELRKILEASNKQMLAKRKRNDWIALGVAIGLAGVIWIINLVV